MCDKKYDDLKKELFYNNEDVWSSIAEENKKEVFAFSDAYKMFLNSCKTERECSSWFINKAKENGFKSICEYEKLKSGDRVFIKNTEKCVMFAIIGKNGIESGSDIVAAHIDAPRLDAKPNPLYEDSSVAYFKTHYYGGIKKYQWLTIPLSIHGTIALKNGETVNLVIGEKEDDPVLCIADLLPHLAQKQMSANASKLVEGEKLNVILGTLPIENGVSEGVKLNILKMLNEQYGITEKDFISADIEIVPAYKAKDVGLDRALVGSYGHDDRVCAYTAFMALMECGVPKRTAICHLVDKEEIGSTDATGMQSVFFENAMAEICYKSVDNYNDIILRHALSNSKCLSADVTAAYDPNFPEVSEKNNSAYLNKGVCFMKYSGARGKSGTSEAQAEFVAEIINLMEENGVVWQISELGKVDEGGGGTVAQFLAMLNIKTIDCGVPLLSMHAPFELAAKADIYSAYKAYSAFYKMK